MAPTAPWTAARPQRRATRPLLTILAPLGPRPAAGGGSRDEDHRTSVLFEDTLWRALREDRIEERLLGVPDDDGVDVRPPDDVEHLLPYLAHRFDARYRLDAHVDGDVSLLGHALDVHGPDVLPEVDGVRREVNRRHLQAVVRLVGVQRVLHDALAARGEAERGLGRLAVDWKDVERQEYVQD